jgi:sodium transport system ATP-binding protein
LLDEPTNGLDIITNRTVSDFVRKSRAEGCCVLFSTHNIAEAELMCDRVIVLHHGSVLACDSLTALLASTGQTNLSHALLKLIQPHEFTAV